MVSQYFTCKNLVFINIIIITGVEIRAELANVTAEDELSYICELKITKDSQSFTYTGQGSFKVYNDPEITIHTVNSPLDLHYTNELG